MNSKIETVVPAREPKLGDVFAKWQEINRKYEEQAEDCIWWCSERSNVGALASAAWLADVCAVTEFKDPCRDEAHLVDLWLKLPNNPKGTAVEAKQVLVSIDESGRRSWIDEVKCRLSSESYTVERLRKSGASLIAAVFVIPRIAKEATWAGPLAEVFQEQVRILADGEKASGDVTMAWYESQEQKPPRLDPASRMRYPGVLFFGRFLPGSPAVGG